MLSADKYLTEAAGILKISKDELAVLQQPERTVEVTIPLERKGKTELYRGYRVQHSSRRGPYKGGLRYHPDVDLAEATLLATLMTLKNAVVGLPLGGGKGGIAVDPKTLSIEESEALTRVFTRRIADVIGPNRDIPAPDVGTGPETMVWIRDEYEKIVGHPAPAVVTGKPIDAGGVKGRELATGEGGLVVLDEIVQRLGKKTNELSVAIQGFGNVGAHLALALERAGYRVVALSNSKGGVYHPKGLHIKQTYEQVRHGEELQKICYRCRLVTNAELLELPVDILAPAAIDNQITKQNAQRIPAQIVLELANNPTTPEADEILARRDVLVIPDILANAGGVTVSYFEWLQNQKGETWPEKRVLEQLARTMRAATEAVWGRKKKHQITLRVAAYLLALERLVTNRKP